MARFAMRDAKLAVQLCHLPLCSARISCLRTTLLLIFSGQPLSGLWPAAQIFQGDDLWLPVFQPAMELPVSHHVLSHKNLPIEEE